MRKIAFTGAGGTGKTTLAKMLSDKTGIPFIPSPSRACFEAMGIKTEDDQLNMTKKDLYKLQMSIFKAIDKQVNETTEGIFDRTHLDNLFYGMFRCHDTIKEDELVEMFKKTTAGLDSFNAVFYTPTFKWDNIADGMRTQHPAPRVMMDFFIEHYLMRQSIRHIVVLNVPVEERCDAIMKMLKLPVRGTIQ